MASEAQRAALRRHYQKNPEYYKEKAAQRTRKLRALAVTAKDIPCQDCGIHYPSYVMDFDHREGEDKQGDVARMASRGSVPKLLAEIAKCDVVCSNCHRERTWQRRQKTLLP